jgi:hypothetical protein
MFQIFKFSNKQVFSFFLGVVSFLLLGLLFVPAARVLALETVDLSGDSIIDANSIDGSQNGIATLILNVAKWVIYIVGALAVIFLIWGALLYLTSAGDEGRAKSGKKTIINAVVGLILAILSFTIVNLIQTILTNGSLSGIFGG